MEDTGFIHRDSGIFHFSLYYIALYLVSVKYLFTCSRVVGKELREILVLRTDKELFTLVSDILCSCKSILMHGHATK